MNIYDIAEQAGVSISTVSRVMNNQPNVAQEKRDRVMEILRKSNYIPSAIAKSLVVKSTNTIGVLLMDVRHLHYANIAYTIEQKLSNEGYNVILCNTGSDQTEQEKYVRVLAEKQVDGMILVGSVMSTPEMKKNISRYFSDRPIVMHNGNISRENIYNISSSAGQGIEQSYDYLYAKGCRHIVFVKDYNTLIAEEKLASFRSRLELYGLTFSNEMVVDIESGLEHGREVIRIIEKRGIDYSGIIGCDDITAVGIVQELKIIGKKVPEDVKVIGFNNSIYARIIEPNLTSIDNKMEAVGLGLARTLMDVLKGIDVPNNISITPELVVRDST